MPDYGRGSTKCRTGRGFLLATLPLAAGCGALPSTAAEPVAGLAAALDPPRHLGPPTPAQAATNRTFQGIPSLAIASGGRLWATWYAGVTPAEDRNNYVVVATSGDGGSTWAERLAIDRDGPGPVRSFDPELWVAPDGRPFCFWAQMEKESGRDVTDGVWTIETADADAAEPAWSALRRLADGVMMCKPIVLSSGEWVLPISRWRTHDDSAEMVVSSDAGQTWSRRGGCNVPQPVRQYDEHMFVERREGSLWLLARTTYGIGESVSSTGARPGPSSRRHGSPTTRRGSSSPASLPAACCS